MVKVSTSSIKHADTPQGLDKNQNNKTDCDSYLNVKNVVWSANDHYAKLITNIPLPIS